MRLRLCLLSQVTIRSPIPVSPFNVSCFAPIVTASLFISNIPLVISAAFVLSPYPRPSAIPAASAITFFNEPPSSMPSTSGLVYTRKTLFMKISWIPSATTRFFAPATTVVGSPIPTSSAWLGPHITATSACGISCSTMSVSGISVSSSIPLATHTMICPSFTKGAMLFAVLLVNTDGTARIRYALPETADSRSVVNSISSGSFTPGSFCTCSCFSFSMVISSSTIDHTVTLFPLVCSTFARAIPQLPAPMIATSAIFSHSKSKNYFCSFFFAPILFSVPFARRLIFARCCHTPKMVKQAVTM